MDVETLAGLSATAIGRALAAGDGDPVELAEFLLARIATHEDQTVFLAVLGDRARREAEASRRRLKEGRPLSALDGVPIAWKDLVDLEGARTTAASTLLQDSPVKSADAPCAANVAGAGMVSIGKVNLTEFAYSGLGLNPHFGTPRNPNGTGPARVPGGSSSGSGVAVAAGLVPCAIGSDTGGSVRIPAAFNGVVGYKSSERRIDKSSVWPLSDTLDTIGPLARSVEDCVHLDAALRGVPLGGVIRADLSTLRLIVPEDSIVLDDLDEAVADNFERMIEALAAAGVSIKRRVVPMLGDMARLTAAHGTLIAAEAYCVHRDVVDGPDAEKVDRRVVARILGGKAMSAHDVLTIQRERRRLAGELAVLLDGAVLAFPTTPLVAPEVAPLDADDELFHTTNLKALRNTALGNFLSLCGLALPSGRDAGGMPTSILFSAPGGDDERLLSYGLSIDRVLTGAR